MRLDQSGRCAHFEEWPFWPELGTHAPARHYRDLWIVRLDDSRRCTHFEEWPFWPELGTQPPSA